MRWFLAISICICLTSDGMTWVYGSVNCGSGTFLVTASNDCSNILLTAGSDNLTAN